MLLPRRRFLTTTAGLTAAGAFTALASTALPLFGQTAPPTAPAPEAQPPKPPPIAPERVRDAVGKSHRDLEAVRALVDAEPLLVHACWDWDGGDFETPLQAAAHTGRREIAEFLLSRGARLDVFAAAMLGHLDFVRAALVYDPRGEIVGPHGFTLLHCAKQGGAAAKPVYDFLLAQGLPEVMRRPLPYRWLTPPPAATS